MTSGAHDVSVDEETKGHQGCSDIATAVAASEVEEQHIRRVNPSDADAAEGGFVEIHRGASRANCGGGGVPRDVEACAVADASGLATPGWSDPRTGTKPINDTIKF